MTDPIDKSGSRYQSGWRCGRDSREPPRTMSPEFHRGFTDALTARQSGRDIDWSREVSVVVDLDEELRMLGVTG